MFKTYEYNKDDYRDKVMTEATCTSTDPTNHQGDTCPVHEQKGKVMTDFMDTALTYQAGIRIAPNSKWVMTNGTIQMDVCTVCAQPYREGHIDCTCPSNHAERCERPTYDQLKAQHDALVIAIEDMEESRENLEGLVQRLTIQNDALVAALNDALHIVRVSSDTADLHDALKDWAHSVECDVLPALEQVK
jgi:hypothetical protein